MFSAPPPDRLKRPPSPSLPPGSPWRAVLTGLAIDLGGTFVLNLLLVTIYTSQLMASGLGADKVQVMLSTEPPPGWMVVIGGLLGSALSVAGGFVCARIVRHDEFRVGGVLAALSPLCALLLSDGGEVADSQQLLLLVSSAACVMLGVHWGRQQNQRDAASSRP